MGKKVNPINFRLGGIFTWSSRWFAPGKKYSETLLEDVNLRKILLKKLKTAGVARVEIERSINKIEVIIYVARPGVVIGRGGAGLEDLKKYIVGLLKTKSKVNLSVEQVKEPNLDAYLVGQNVADQLIKRLPAKRVLGSMIEKVMGAGAKGVRIRLSGRIGGAEIARVQHEQAGVLPLSTFRENIDFASVPALTRSGYVGVKVWICKK
jgi:small subunit ribosomal protein S3